MSVYNTKWIALPTHQHIIATVSTIHPNVIINSHQFSKYNKTDDIYNAIAYYCLWAYNDHLLSALFCECLFLFIFRFHRLLFLFSVQLIPIRFTFHFFLTHVNVSSIIATESKTKSCQAYTYRTRNINCVQISSWQTKNYVLFILFVSYVCKCKCVTMSGCMMLKWTTNWILYTDLILSLWQIDCCYHSFRNWAQTDIYIINIV